MQKSQRLLGMLIVIALAVGIAILNDRSRGDSTGTLPRSRGALPTVGVGLGAEPTATRPPRPSATNASAPTAQRQVPQPRGQLPPIAFAELPPEALATIKLIHRGGPFPYEKDGSIFRNRERLLPRQPEGYYREYTVQTPGEDDRGARRIVAGRNGELYYTDDHYESFWEVE